MNLLDLREGEEGIITKIKGRGTFRKRITEMGFVKGKTVRVVKFAPMRDPVEYSIMGYDVSLRRSEAALIEITKDLSEIVPPEFQGVITDDVVRASLSQKKQVIDIALVGNPNAGKTTLFNFASNSHEHVGNYSGVTVESKIAEFEYNGYQINLVDLPGTYSLSAYSPEELYVRNYIVDKMPDVVINVVDASNLERNLYLTTQLIDLDVKVVVALNMYDELQKKGDIFDYDEMGKMLGIPFIPVISNKGKGIDELLYKVIEVYEDKAPFIRHIHINYGEDVEAAVKNIQHSIWKNPDSVANISSRYISLRLLERDKDIERLIGGYSNAAQIRSQAMSEINTLESLYNEDTETILADAKYGFIKGALKETYKRLRLAIDTKSTTHKIDRILTHKYLGFPIFLVFLFIMFEGTFYLGHYPMQWMEQGVLLLGNLFRYIIPAGIVRDMFIEGIIGGVGGVIVFLPNILFLFFFISIMEDTGYMARVAFIMDKLMHLIGLHGKSFIPLIMGFGCNVPAIMATRTLENRKDRLLTMLINPFMSCSARLPVYILIAGAIFPRNPVLVILSLYLFGVILSILFALLFKSTLFRKKEAPFVMELPPYRMPTARSVTRHVWHKGSQYLKKMGGIILIASMIIWFLGYFPRDVKYSKDYVKMENEIKQTYDSRIADASGAQEAQLMQERDSLLETIIAVKEREHQEGSLLGIIGRTIEPVIRPLGFDWKMGISLMSGVAAKEVVISTLGVLYQADANPQKQKTSLMEKIRSQKYDHGPKIGQKVYTPLVSIAFLLFILIYFPCVAVVAAVKKESGSWKWAAFMAFYTTFTAWLIAFIVYQVGMLL